MDTIKKLLALLDDEFVPAVNAAIGELSTDEYGELARLCEELGATLEQAQIDRS